MTSPPRDPHSGPRVRGPSRRGLLITSRLCRFTITVLHGVDEPGSTRAACGCSRSAGRWGARRGPVDGPESLSGSCSSDGGRELDPLRTRADQGRGGAGRAEETQADVDQVARCGDRGMPRRNPAVPRGHVSTSAMVLALVVHGPGVRCCYGRAPVFGTLDGTLHTGRNASRA